MERLVFLISRRQNVFFTELAAALGAELTALGIPVAHADGVEQLGRGDVPVVIPPHEWWALEGDVIAPALRRRSIYISAEQPGTGFFDRDVELATDAGAVFDINPAAVRAYRAAGVEAQHLQLGWTAAWEHTGDVERDVDALFLGCATQRRAQVLARFADCLDARRSRLVFSDNGAPNTGTSATFLAGGDKWPLLRRSRVLLNIHQDERDYFEWLRIVQAITNGCVVVSEHASDFEPLVPGAHLLFGAASSLPHLTTHLLDDEDTRRALADRALDFLRSQLPLSAAAERIARSAEKLSGPARPAPGAGWTPRPAPPLPTPQAILSAATDDALVRAAIKDIRLENLELRRTLLRVLAQQQHGTALPEVQRDESTPAWRGADARASVLVTAYNYGHHVTAALDSVAASSVEDTEIVVVDDGSADDTADEVRRWLRTHPRVPALLVRHPINRGLPHARNTAADFARGEYLFILDADNELLPRGLARLVQVLDADPDAAIAYGMLQRHYQGEPNGLMSIYPWDPRRLALGNYIDAMALVRRSALRAVGGYTTDTRLHGWEDYDLWCHLANNGRYGVFVPEIVGRYLSSPHSMLSVTNLSWQAAQSLLAVRYPRVFRAPVEAASAG